MSEIIHFRPDGEVSEALRYLGARPELRNRSKVLREAVLTAAREARRRDLIEEARRLARDPDDRAEIAAIQADLEPLRAW